MAKPLKRFRLSSDVDQYPKVKICFKFLKNEFPD